MSETKIGQTFIDMFQEAKGRVIVAMFASNVHRIQMVVDSAAMFGRKVCFIGRSMVNVTPRGHDHRRIAHSRGIHDRRGRSGQLSRRRDAGGHHRQSGRGHGRSDPYGLRRAPQAADSSHATWSSSPPTPIPGNEKPVARVINQLYRCGANVIYESAGRGPRLRPRLSGRDQASPCAGASRSTSSRSTANMRNLWQHAELAEELGVNEFTTLLFPRSVRSSR